MEEENAGRNDFRTLFGESLKRSLPKSSSVQVFEGQNVYVVGDRAEDVYFIEKGQIKLIMLSAEGKQCLLGIYTIGDIFGELCLSRPTSRQETATAMEAMRLRRIPCDSFLSHLRNHSLAEEFLQYLAVRIGDQQQIIASLITVDSEHRLAETLLLLARKLGRHDLRDICIEHRITHEELSEMVGTTRPRITGFMKKFRLLGMIGVTPKRYLLINEKKLVDFLARSA